MQLGLKELGVDSEADDIDEIIDDQNALVDTAKKRGNTGRAEELIAKIGKLRKFKDMKEEISNL